MLAQKGEVLPYVEAALKKVASFGTPEEFLKWQKGQKAALTSRKGRLASRQSEWDEWE